MQINSINQLMVGDCYFKIPMKVSHLSVTANSTFWIKFQFTGLTCAHKENKNECNKTNSCSENLSYLHLFDTTTVLMNISPPAQELS